MKKYISEIGENFGFWYVNDDVIKVFHDEGFTNIQDNHGGKRPWIGPVVVNGIDYYLPLTSNYDAEEKKYKKESSFAFIEFIDEKGNRRGAIQVYNMTPLYKTMVHKYDTKIQDDEYKKE